MSVFDRIEEARRRQEETEVRGVPALERLVRVAHGNTGQSRDVRRFLLGLYNGYAWPFPLPALRGLDRELQADAVAVLEMDMTPRVEVHQRIEHGTEVFETWADAEREREASR